MEHSKIATSGLKVDFHIHSAASSHKDGVKVKYNTVENLSTLVSALKTNQVNMCSITDHDAFDCELYKELKKQEEEPGSIKRVLPGIEFSVMYEPEKNHKVPIHVVTIFDDANKNSIERISSCIPKQNNKPDYDEASAFSENKYWDIIKDIGLDVILIAHQKNSLSSKKPRSADANSVGEKAFNEFLFMDYFEAYEYKNRKNELFNKKYVYERSVLDKLRFITGSDCHVWSCYPKYDSASQDEMHYTYLKCLPTFKGLAMAVTDSSRMKTVNSFFNATAPKLESLKIDVAEKSYDVPLSPGINVIIGDNSIGKSLLISKITEYEGVPSDVKMGYENYLEANDINIEAPIGDCSFTIDHQGVVKKKFENLDKGRVAEDLAKHFPEDVDPEPYRVFAQGQVEKFLSAIQASVDFWEQFESLGVFSIPEYSEDIGVAGLKITGSIKRPAMKKETGLVGKIETVRTTLQNMESSYADVITTEDFEVLKVIDDALKEMEERHRQVIRRIQLEDSLINAITAVLNETRACFAEQATDIDKVKRKFLEDQELTTTQVAAVIAQSRQMKSFTFDFTPRTIEPNVNPVSKYLFVSKLNVDEISPDFLNKLVSDSLKKGGAIDFRSVTKKSLRDLLKNYPEDEDDPVQVLRKKIQTGLSGKLLSRQTIVKNEDDVSGKLSQGYNAQIYFSLLADASVDNGIYIIDQPEDQISQKAIKSAVIQDFRELSQWRQVIIVTHNPQFIVNLDADNVIFLGRDKENRFTISSGALEYECGGYKILDVVADNVEGGLDTIRKRLKRYEKVN